MMKKISNFSIRNKLLLNSLVVIGFIIIIVFVVSLQLHQAREYTSLLVRYSEEMTLLQEISVELKLIDINIDKYFVIGGETYRENVLSDLDKINNNINIISSYKNLDHEEVIDLNNGIKNLTSSINEIFTNEKVSPREANNIVIKYYASFREIENLIQENVKNKINNIESNISLQEKTLNNTINQVLYLGSLIIIFGVISSIYLSRKISKPIISLDLAAKKIGKGELDVDIKIDSNDEIGGLAKTFMQMTKDLSESRKEIEKYSRELENKVEEKTKDLEEKIEELQKFQNISVGRELKMIELKEKIKKLEEKGQDNK